MIKQAQDQAASTTSKLQHMSDSLVGVSEGIDSVEESVNQLAVVTAKVGKDQSERVGQLVNAVDTMKTSMVQAVIQGASSTETLLVKLISTLEKKNNIG